MVMLTLSKTNGIGGAIKDTPDDFLVEEITETGAVLELNKLYTPTDLGIQEPEGDTKFTTFILQKKDWNTTQALTTIARRFRRGIRSMGFAGMKDKKAISAQMCSVFGIKPEQVRGLKMKDVKINGAWKSSDSVRMGQLAGNRFTITVKDVKSPENIEKIHKELDGIFPNYFGEQRFGFRDNNVDIGLDILKANFEEAAMKFLTGTNNERNEEAVHAREQLAAERDFRRAADYFPGYLRYERQVISKLAETPTDFAGAMRMLPRNILLMFVHAVESHVFNMEVSARIKEGASSPQGNDKLCYANDFGFPNIKEVVSHKDAAPGRKAFVIGNLVGYESEVNDFEKRILDELGITQQHFKVPNMPELSCRGAHRVLFAPYTNFEKSADDGAKLRFSLPAGAYATVLMHEFLKSER